MSSVEAPQAKAARQAELLGANDAALQLGAAPVDTRVRLDRPTTARVVQSLQSMAAPGGAAREPDRVYLNLENVRSESGSGSYLVYVALPEGANPAEHLLLAYYANAIAHLLPNPAAAAAPAPALSTA